MSQELLARIAQLESQVATLTHEVNDLKDIAYKDELTGIYNRRKFEKDYKNVTTDYGYLYIDLNFLKQANDNYGHEEGDRLIKLLAQCLRSEMDSCYRLGGDEFGAIVNNVTIEELHIVINRLRTKFHLSGVSGSIGWYHSSETGDGKKIADKRMYEDKTRIKKSFGYLDSNAR